MTLSFVRSIGCPSICARSSGEPESLNGTNDIGNHVFANETCRQAVLVLRPRRLVQNLMLMLGQ